MRAAGVPLGRAMDIVNVIATFTIGHTLAEAGQTPGHEGSEPNLDERAHELDPALLVECRHDLAVAVLLAQRAPAPDAVPTRPRAATNP